MAVRGWGRTVRIRRTLISRAAWPIRARSALSALRARQARPFGAAGSTWRRSDRLDSGFDPARLCCRSSSAIERSRAAISASDSHFWSFIATDSTKQGSFVVRVRGESTRSAVSEVAPGRGGYFSDLFRLAASEGDTPRRQLLVVVPDVTARVAPAVRANLAGHGDVHVKAAALRADKAEFSHEQEECKPPAWYRAVGIRGTSTSSGFRYRTERSQSAGSLDVVLGPQHGYAPGVSSL